MDRTAIGGVTRRAHSHPPQPMDEASLTMDDPAIYPTPLPNGMAITNIDMTNERSSLSNKSVITKNMYLKKLKLTFTRITRLPEKINPMNTCWSDAWIWRFANSNHCARSEKEIKIFGAFYKGWSHHHRCPEYQTTQDNCFSVVSIA